MRKLKVLIFHPAMAPYRLDFFNALDDVLDLKVVFFRDNCLSQKFDQEQLLSSARFNYDYLLKGFDLCGRSFRIGVWRLINEYCPDVIVTSGFSPMTLYVLLLRKYIKSYKWGVSVWTDDNLYVCSTRGFVKSKIVKYISNIADSIVVCTKECKSWYIDRGFTNGKIFNVGVLHSESSFRQLLANASATAHDYIKRYSLQDKKTILYVGRLVELKGVNRLIDSFALLSNHDSSLVLTIVGDGPMRSCLETQAKKLGIQDRIYFVGHLEGDDLKAWYCLANLFVLLSDWEQYGAVVNEALIAGVPVVCSKYAGASELIREGYNGYVVDPYDNNCVIESSMKCLAETQFKSDEKVINKQSLMPSTLEEVAMSFVGAVKYAECNRRVI